MASTRIWYFQEITKFAAATTDCRSILYFIYIFLVVDIAIYVHQLYNGHWASKISLASIDFLGVAAQSG